MNILNKPYINQKELCKILNLGERNAKKVSKYLIETAKKKKLYIPDSKKDIFIPTSIIKEELHITTYHND